MIVVTGGAGFIGSHLVLKLNMMGKKDIIVVDNLKNSQKNSDLIQDKIAGYIDKNDFIRAIEMRDKICEDIEFVFHQGACTVTTEQNTEYMMNNNYVYSKTLLDFCIERTIPFIYASSAAIYGLNTKFFEEEENEEPINIYGQSKWMFDQYVRDLEIRNKLNSQVVGLRYFNVFGPHETHKKIMSSVIFHFNKQIDECDELKLFSGSGGYGDGEQRRDFVYVDDVIKVNIWMMDNKNISGIYNVGTGESFSFNDIANTIIKRREKGKIKYIPFPKELEKNYQSFTQADLKKLRSTGYTNEFMSVNKGINLYLDRLLN